MNAEAGLDNSVTGRILHKNFQIRQYTLYK